MQWNFFSSIANINLGCQILSECTDDSHLNILQTRIFCFYQRYVRHDRSGLSLYQTAEPIEFHKCIQNTAADLLGDRMSFRILQTVLMLMHDVAGNLLDILSTSRFHIRICLSNILCLDFK